jgi:tetratricopeptide (TPR) repeat protein
MIQLLLAAAVVSTAPAAVLPNPRELIAGAEHAVWANRLDQATLMIARAVSAGAVGPELDRVLGDLAYASGRYDEASARYQSLLKTSVVDERLLEHAGIAALKLGDVKNASLLLSRATSARGASWRAWNALGVAADLRSDWVTADACYDNAAQLAPDEVEPVNNRGWSHLLRGNWKEALSLFEKAVALDPKSARAANNLELARSALAAELPSRRAGESDSSWAARLNDAGVAAAILGDKGRATAAFSQALDVSGTWYVRAANNLEALRGR